MGTHNTRSTTVTVPATPESDWQRIWFALRQHDWSSIAIVPSHEGVDVATVADTLCEMGRVEGDRPVTIVSALGVQLSDVSQVIDDVASATSRRQLVLVPVDPLADNPTTIGVLRATSAALLVVRLGESELSTTREVVEAIGRERVIGSIVLEANSPSGRKPGT